MAVRKHMDSFGVRAAVALSVLTAILLALVQLADVCPQVHITGFSFFDGPTHYFSSKQITPRNHDIDSERRLLQKLLEPAIAGGRVSLDPIMNEHLFGGAGRGMSNVA